MGMPPEVVSKEYIQRLYNNSERNADTEQEIGRVFDLAEDIGPLQYYCSILFYNAACEKRFPAYLSPLLSSCAYTSFLLSHHLGIELSETGFASAKGHLLQDGSPERSNGCLFFKRTKGDSPVQSQAPLGKEMRMDHSLNNSRNTDSEDPEQQATKRIRLSTIRALNNGTSNRKLLLFLFRIESEYHETSELDISFVRTLFDTLSAKAKSKILASPHVTPLKIHLSNAHPHNNDFYSFCALESIGLADAFRKAKDLQPRPIKRAILRSEFSSIRARLAFFYRMFPEMKTYDRVVSENRLEYINMPERIPLKCKLLRTYIQVISGLQAGPATIIDEVQRQIIHPKVSSYSAAQGYFGDHPEPFRGAGRSPVDLEMYFIGRILALGDGGPLYSVVNCWFTDSSRLVDVFLQKRPQISSLSTFVRRVPAIIDYFSLIVQFAKNTREAYYTELLLAIMTCYPKREHAILVRSNLLYFDPELISKIKHLLDEAGK